MLKIEAPLSKAGSSEQGERHFIPVSAPGSIAPGRRLKEKGAGPKASPKFLDAPPLKRREPFLPAGAGAEGDLHAPVLRLADTIRRIDQRPALAERLGRDRTVGNAAAGQVGANIVGAPLRQANVVGVRTGTVGVTGEGDRRAAGLLIGSGSV